MENKIIEKFIFLIFIALLMQTAVTQAQTSFIQSRYMGAPVSATCSDCNPVVDGVAHIRFDPDSVRLSSDDGGKDYVTFTVQIRRVGGTGTDVGYISASGFRLKYDNSVFGDNLNTPAITEDGSADSQCSYARSEFFTSVALSPQSLPYSLGFTNANSSELSVNEAHVFEAVLLVAIAPKTNFALLGSTWEDMITLTCEIPANQEENEAGFGFAGSQPQGIFYRMFPKRGSSAISSTAFLLADNDMRGLRLDGKTWAEDYVRYGDGKGVRLQFSKGIKTQLTVDDFNLTADGMSTTITRVLHTAGEAYAQVEFMEAIVDGTLRLSDASIMDVDDEALADGNFLAALNYDEDVPRVTTATRVSIVEIGGNNHSTWKIDFSSALSDDTVDASDICVTETNGLCVAEGETPTVPVVSVSSSGAEIELVVNEGNGKSGGVRSIEFRRNAVLGADFKVVEDYQAPLRDVITIADILPPEISITVANADGTINEGGTVSLVSLIPNIMGGDRVYSYEWSQISGSPLELENINTATLNVAIPADFIVSSDAVADVAFKVVVNDGVFTTSLSKVVTINKIDNGGPVIRGEVRPSRVSVIFEQADADGAGVFSYQWQQRKFGEEWTNVVDATTPTYWLPTDTNERIRYRVNIQHTDGQRYTTNYQLGPLITGVIDDDGDGLIDVYYLEDIDAMRYQLDATSYKMSMHGGISTQGCPTVGCSGYELRRDLDFAADASYGSTSSKVAWTTGVGWQPIGSTSNPFSGVFEGNGYTIANLYIQHPTRDSGFFSTLDTKAKVQNVGLLDVNVEGSGESTNNIGSLVGSNNGSIINSYATGNVAATTSSLSFNSGGLVGDNIGSIINSYTMVDVKGSSSVGGLAGANSGSIINSYTTGAVEGTRDNIGGLVGVNSESGSIENTYAEGTVMGRSQVGGLVGQHNGSMINSYAALGVVNGSGSNIGGLVGMTVLTATITTSYWDQTVNSILTTSARAKTTAELQSPTAPGMTTTEAYYGWDNKVWDFGDSKNYPALRYAEGGELNACNTDIIDIDIRTSSTMLPCGLLLPNQRGRDQGLAWVFFLANGGEVSEELTPLFAPHTDNYDVTIVTIAASIQLRPYAIDNTEMITITKPDDDTNYFAGKQNGALSDAIELETDETALTMVITDAMDEATTYTFVIMRLWPIRVDVNQSRLHVIAEPDKDGILTMQWQQQILGAGWTNITDATTATYWLPANADERTRYRVNVQHTDNENNITNYPTQGPFRVGIDNDGDGLIDIYTLDDLDAIRYQLDGSGYKPNENAEPIMRGCPAELCEGYELRRDLDFNDNTSYSSTTSRVVWTMAAGWQPIGSMSDPFSSVFEGNGYTISNLYIKNPANDIGLFSLLDLHGEIKNVQLLDANVQAAAEFTNDIGSLVGENHGSIINSYATGHVKGTTDSRSFNSGGLIGHNIGFIINSYATVDVIGSSGVGGLVGANSGSIMSSYASGNITATGNNSGGLVGFNDGGSITNTYAEGTVMGVSQVGGLVGQHNGLIFNSYAFSPVNGNGDNIGGLVGAMDPAATITASYWDTVASGQVTSVGGSAQTTDELQTPTAPGITAMEVYYDWDDKVWDFGDGKNYPALRYTQGDDLNACNTDSIDIDIQTPSTMLPCGLLLPNQRGRDQGLAWVFFLANDGEVSEELTPIFAPFIGSYDVTIVTIASSIQLRPYASDNTEMITITKPDDDTDYFAGKQNGALSDAIELEVDETVLTMVITDMIGEDQVNTTYTFSLVRLWPIRVDVNRSRLRAIASPDDEGTLTMQWQQRTLGQGWTNIAGATTATYWLPADVDGSIRYRVNVQHTDEQGNIIHYPTQGPFRGSIDDDSDGLIDIYTLEELDAMRYQLDGSGYKPNRNADPVMRDCPQQVCSGYELRRDLDFNNDASYSSTANKVIWTQDPGWDPIGHEDNIFSSRFEGNGYTISNLHINRSESLIGLFSTLDAAAVIKNVGLLDVYVRDASAENEQVGSLVGHNGGIIINSYATGNVDVASSQVGGLVGFNESGSQIISSFSNVAVTGQDKSGGLVGQNEGSITNSYITGSVSGTNDIGGLVGYNDGSITNSYAVGLVSGDGNNIGGLVGMVTDNATITASYWDTNTSMQPMSADGISKTTTQLQTPTAPGITEMEVYYNWDNKAWDFGDSKNYPALRYVAGDELNACNNDVSILSELPVCDVLLSNQNGRDKGVTGVFFLTNDPRATMKFPLLLSSLTYSYDITIITTDSVIRLRPYAINDDATIKITDQASTENYFADKHSGALSDDIPLADEITITIVVTDMIDDSITATTYTFVITRLTTPLEISATDISPQNDDGTINEGDDVTITVGEVTGGSGDYEYEFSIDEESSPPQQLSSYMYRVPGNTVAANAATQVVELNIIVRDKNDIHRPLEYIEPLMVRKVDNGLPVIDFAGTSKTLTVTIRADTEPDGVAALPRYEYEWQQRLPEADAWTPIQTITTNTEIATYNVADGPFTGSRFRVLVTLRDGQDYIDTVSVGNYLYRGDVTDDNNNGLIDIYTLEDLNALRNNLNASYELRADLNFKDPLSYADTSNMSKWVVDNARSRAGWEPISAGGNFSGVLDGNGHTIANLYINRTAKGVGLFSILSATGTIKNVGLLDVDVQGGGTFNYIGSLVGQNNGLIINSYAAGSIRGRGSSNIIGGLVGTNTGSIINSYASGVVNGNRVVGGLAGQNQGSIINSYATGNIQGHDPSGGLVGDNTGSITNSYALSQVQSRSRAGGLVGTNSGNITASYWNTETSRQARSAGGTAKTTAELQSPTAATGIYSDWNSSDWDFGDSTHYPALRYAAGGDDDLNACNTDIRISPAMPLCGMLLPNQSDRNQGLAEVFFLVDGEHVVEEFTPLFSPLTNSYDVTIVTTATNVQLRPYAINNNAMIEITRPGSDTNYFVAKTNGALSDPIELEDNATTITIVITDIIDGTTASTMYTFIIVKSLPIRVDVSRSWLRIIVTTLAAEEFSYQWQQQALGEGWTNIDGATTATYWLPLDANGSIRYRVINIKHTDDEGNITDYPMQGPFRVSIDDDADGLIDIYTLDDLDAIRYQLDGSAYKTVHNVQPNKRGCPAAVCKGYELMRSLDFNTDTSYRSTSNKVAWTTDEGWVSIGHASNRFRGVFEGNGYTLSGLYINRPDSDHIGLFSALDADSEIKNVRLLDVDIRGRSRIGGLAGDNGGDITNSYVMGGTIANRIRGSGLESFVGGLVGFNESRGEIISSFANVIVTGQNRVGGLVGQNEGSIMSSYAAKNVTGLRMSSADGLGGLVGYNYGLIMNSYATGNVIGRAHSAGFGGLVGYNYSSIINSYATGAVRGNGRFSTEIGGLVGYNKGSIKSTYAKGAVWGNFQVGGLVGDNLSSIINSYASGQVSGSSSLRRDLGGLVGRNYDGNITNSYAIGRVIGRSNAGGLVGNNSGSVTASYWDSMMSQQGSSAGGIAKTTAELQTPIAPGMMATEVYYDWSSNDWDFGDSTHYPALRYAADDDLNTCTTDITSSSMAPPCGILLSKQSNRKGLAGVFFLVDGKGIRQEFMPLFSPLTYNYDVAVVTLGRNIQLRPYASNNDATITITDPSNQNYFAGSRLNAGLSDTIGVPDEGTTITIVITDTINETTTDTIYTFTIKFKPFEVPQVIISPQTVVNADGTVNEGSNVTFMLSAPASGGSGTYSYEWTQTPESLMHLSDGSLTLSSANNATLNVVIPADFIASGFTVTNVTFNVVVSDGDSIIRRSKVLTINKIDNGSPNIEVAVNSSRLQVISVESDPDGSGVYSYQWQQRGLEGEWMDIADATTSTYWLSGGANGSMRYRVNIKHTDGQGYITDYQQGPFRVGTIDDDDDGLIDLYYLEDLNAIRYQLDGSGYKMSLSATTSTQGCPATGCIGYELRRDLDFNTDTSYSSTSNKVVWTTVAGWQPIGSSTHRFDSIFEGNGHTISNLYINRAGQATGLFSALGANREIRNVGLSINVHGGGGQDIPSAGLVGHNYGSIINSRVTTGTIVGLETTGTIVSLETTGTIVGLDLIGGLVGINESSGKIISSFANAKITVTGSSSGGLVGWNQGSIINSYATGSIIASRANSGIIGGLVGHNSGSISHSYALGRVRGSGSDIGGLVGRNSGNITVSYWDRETSGQATSAGGSDKTTAELQTPTAPATTSTGVYYDWNQSDWDFGDSTNYPALRYAVGDDLNGCEPDITTSTKALPCGILLPNQRGRKQGLAGIFFFADDVNVSSEIMPLFTPLADSYNALIATSDTNFRLTLRPYTLNDTAKITITDQDGTNYFGENQLSGALSDAIMLDSGKTLSVVVTDTINGVTVNTTYTFVVAIALTLSEVVVGLDPAINADGTIDEGSLVTITFNVVGGSGAYQYEYLIDDQPLLSSTPSSLVYRVPIDLVKPDSVIQTVELKIIVSDEEQTVEYTEYLTVRKVNNGDPVIRPDISFVRLRLIFEGTDADGEGRFTMQWQKEVIEDAWMDIADATTATYWLPADANIDIRYRAINIRYTDGQGFETNYDDQGPFLGAIMVTGDIGGESLANEGETLVLTAPTVSGGSGRYSYQWSQTAVNSAHLSNKSPLILTGDNATLNVAIPADFIASDAISANITFEVVVRDGAFRESRSKVVTINKINNGSSDIKTKVDSSRLRISLVAPDPDGEGDFSIQWQSQAPGEAWIDIDNATTTTYWVPANASRDISYRAIDIEHTDGQGYVTSYDDQGPFLGKTTVTGGIDGEPRVNEGEILVLTAPTVSGGSGEYIYQWSQTVENSAYLSNKSTLTLTGDAALNIAIPADFIALDATSANITFKVVVIDDEFTTSRSKVVTIHKINNSSPTIKVDVSLARLRISLATPDADGKGDFSLQWQSQVLGEKWTDIDNATTTTYWVPAGADADSEIRYRAIDIKYTDGQGYEIDYDDQGPFLGATMVTGGIDGVTQISEGENLMLTAPMVSGGIGAYVYQWSQTVANSAHLSNKSTLTLIGDDALNVAIPADFIALAATSANITFKVVVIDGEFTTSRSKVVTINKMNNGVANISIAEASGTLTVTVGSDPDGDTVASSYTYQWQSQVLGEKWTDINDATTTTYYIDPDLPTATRFRVVVTYTDGQGYLEKPESNAIQYTPLSRGIKIRTKVFLEGPLR